MLCVCLLGTCIETSNTTFIRHCAPGWMGSECQTMIDYCRDVSCLNDGVCRPTLQNYTCDCLAGSYSGRHCEMKTNQLALYQTVSKSFAYVVIIAMMIVAMCIVVLDVMKYCFGIDPIDRRLQSKRRKKPPTIVRYIYIHAPL